MSDLQTFYHELMMARSGAERLRMGAEMYSAARLIVLAAKPPDLPAAEWILRRFYGSELDEEEIQEFLRLHVRG